MRAYIFPSLFILPFLMVPLAPYTGVLLWAWITFMNPHQIAGGWVSTIPINMAVVSILAVALALHRERVVPFIDPLIVAIILFVAWTVLTTMDALSPAVS